MSKNIEIIQFRAHHICCSDANRLIAGDRGVRFAQQLQFIDNILHSETAKLQVTEGVDCVCAECLYRKGDRCDAPEGGDIGVRKWDAILIKELGIAFGTVMSASEWRTLLEKKKPFQLCLRCNYRLICQTAKPDR